MVDRAFSCERKRNESTPGSTRGFCSFPLGLARIYTSHTILYQQEAGACFTITHHPSPCNATACSSVRGKRQEEREEGDQDDGNLASLPPPFLPSHPYPRPPSALPPSFAPFRNIYSRFYASHAFLPLQQTERVSSGEGVKTKGKKPFPLSPSCFLSCRALSPPFLPSILPILAIHSTPS